MTNEMTLVQATERVARGMAWIMANAESLDLDLSRVDLGTVNVVDDHNCVLAQAGGRPFWDVLENVHTSRVDGVVWTIHNGFAAPTVPGGLYPGATPEQADREAAVLADAWRYAIQVEREDSAS